jgi:hypothetical protein
MVVPLHTFILINKQISPRFEEMTVEWSFTSWADNQGECRHMFVWIPNVAEKNILILVEEK